MSLAEEMDTVTAGTAGTVDRHATARDLRVDRPGHRRGRRRLPGARRGRRRRDRRARPRSPPSAGASSGFDGRRQRLAAWRGYLARRMHELADLVHRENGKPHADAILEITLAVDHLAWAGAHAPKTLGLRRVGPGLLAANHAAYLEYQPLGVVGVIGPWNYPVFTPMGSIAYALAAGNAVVFKPSEYTPAVGAWLAAAWRAAVPDCRRRLPGRHRLRRHRRRAVPAPASDKLAFTGSAPTGRKVMAACAETLTPVLMELGGKDAMIVDDDADVVAAADAAVWGAMSNAGQTCIGIERVYATERGLRPVRRRGHRAGARAAARFGRRGRLRADDDGVADRHRPPARRGRRWPPAAAPWSAAPTRRRSRARTTSRRPCCSTSPRPRRRSARRPSARRSPITRVRDAEEALALHQRHQPTAWPARCSRSRRRGRWTWPAGCAAA